MVTLSIPSAKQGSRESEIWAPIKEVVDYLLSLSQRPLLSFSTFHVSLLSRDDRSRGLLLFFSYFLERKST